MDESKMTELNKALEGVWDSLTDEQRAKAKECRSMDELAALAGAAGVELPDEMLYAVAGGLKFPPRNYIDYCPYCKYEHEFGINPANSFAHYCARSGKEFRVKNGKYYAMDGKCLGDIVDVAPRKNGCG